MALGENSNTFILIAVGIVGVLGIVTLALAAATLGTFNKQSDYLNHQINILHDRLIQLDYKIATTITTTKATYLPTAVVTTEFTTTNTDLLMSSSKS